MQASDVASTSAVPMDSARPNAGAGAAGDGLGWVEPPAGLSLQQVHYLVRHGERTPVRTRLTHLFPQRWNLCHAGRKFEAAVLDLTPTTEDSRPTLNVGRVDIQTQGHAGRLRVNRAVEGEDSQGRPVRGEEGECLLGELTDLGRLSTLRFGRELRSLYIDKLGFLPQRLTPDDADKVYFRSTNMSRTIETLQQLIRGMHPQTMQPASPAGTAAAFVPQVLVRNGTNENLLPNTFGCSRLRSLDRAFADAAARALNPSLEKLDAKTMPYTNGVPMRVDGHPRLNGLFDTIRAAQSHGFKVPPVFLESETQSIVENAIVGEWFSGYQAEDPEKRLEFRRLAMGRLLEDLAGRMQKKADKGDAEALKFALYATHDTSLAGLLCTLDCFDFRWPVFTASVGIELFQDQKAAPSIFGRAKSLMSSLTGGAAASSDHYVRVRYGDRTMKLPACADQGKHYEGHPELCTLEAFRGIVKELQHPKGWNWEQQCAVGQGATSSK
ncbi:uncharacterized protein PFL1_02916 [Pseudozyma flocculosa PF-1]|uniref:Related to acid phosphatase ACP2 n=2 Tax=Pseudozyma flocculosa TaxID=84751 RepID=A0A5C3F1V2_9BASI|nr:uncharacterized protein PFL1_02916 [Pseudozyma flocculosa PF-1]EPQ29696.1 hypothetical protein PFL1_02916 [Pseudozyma flocculosa PF-1]SPO38272.1 related to acid phosphatase ACP2 precursor [Pseudozyma flocculosa]